MGTRQTRWAPVTRMRPGSKHGQPGRRRARASSRRRGGQRCSGCPTRTQARVLGSRLRRLRVRPTGTVRKHGLQVSQAILGNIEHNMNIRVRLGCTARVHGPGTVRVAARATAAAHAAAPPRPPGRSGSGAQKKRSYSLALDPSRSGLCVPAHRRPSP